MEGSKEEKGKSALKVNEGVEQPSQVSSDAIKRIKTARKPLLTAEEYAGGIRKGDRNLLGRAITLVESALPEHTELAQEIIRLCLPYSGNSFRIGITGVPGAGKSTFIEAFGGFLTSNDNKVAVLAIDPSSQRSKGSILGDKTRMENLSTNPKAFIRPSPSAGSLGGVARKTRETIVLCEAAGFEVILVETVGVGQSETAVHSMVDFFLLIMISGAGDELQGIKRGIMEMADAILVNKADGSNIDKAGLAKTELQMALHLFPPPESGWTARVELCSSLHNTGIDKAWEMMQDYRDFTMNNNYFESKRSFQEKFRMMETIEQKLMDSFYNDSEIKKKIAALEEDVMKHNISPYQAAQELINLYSGKG